MKSSTFEKIWELSPHYYLPESYNKLLTLTRQLIDAYNEDGRLDENPFTPTTKRKLSLPSLSVNSLLENKICLVTGGLGCVGSALVNKLIHFNVEKIIVVDKEHPSQVVGIKDSRVIYVQCDICDAESLYAIFKAHQPEYVFHTAAQRNPGLAEKQIVDTISRNIFGTLNVVNACEMATSVKQCVFSSTGKASRYYTKEIYAATKKICEYIFDVYAKRSSIRYTMVRFTHILDNSLMNMELRDLTAKDHLPIHSPGKYVTAQNVSEAVDLLLNALIHSTVGQCKFLIVRNLEWPVESLEVALYYIRKAGSPIPVVFRGNPPGYSEKFFRGQMDWSSPQDLNLLINVYESNYRRLNKEGDIVISQILPTDSTVLAKAIKSLQIASDERHAKETLWNELRNLVQASLVHADHHDTLNILKWGLEPEYLLAENAKVEDFQPLVALLTESLRERQLLEQIEYLVPGGNFSSDTHSLNACALRR